MTYKEFYKQFGIIYQEWFKTAEKFSHEGLATKLWDLYVENKIEDSPQEQSTHQENLKNETLDTRKNKLIQDFLEDPDEVLKFSDYGLECTMGSSDTSFWNAGGNNKDLDLDLMRVIPQEQPTPLTKDEVEGKLKHLLNLDHKDEYALKHLWFWEDRCDNSENVRHLFRNFLNATETGLLEKCILHPDNAWLFRQEVIDALKEPEKPKKKTFEERFIHTTAFESTVIGPASAYVLMIPREDFEELREIHKKWEQE